MSKLVILGLFASLGFNAAALPLPKGPKASVAIPFTFTQQEYNYEGIVELNNCSASLVRLENSRATDQAMVFTNGHCLETGFPDPGTYVYHQPSRRSFGLMNATGQVVARLKASEIVYSTMTKTDLTIYKVHGETYSTIETKYGIRPLTLSSVHPEIGQPIEIISGYWNRGYTCAIEAFAYQLKEGVFTWEDSIRYSRPGCEVIGGTSGSPVLAAGTRTMIAINNTGNEDGRRCTDNNPCEVDEHGNISYQMGFNYAEQTYQVYTCLNQNNEIDLSVEGCKLHH